MKVVVTSNGMDLSAEASPSFGRCLAYVFVDTETMEFEAIENPAANAAGGAGIQAAQFVVEQGVQAVLAGNVGPNAYDVLKAANMPVFRHAGGTVRQAVEAYMAGKLQAVGGANVGSHAGMGMKSGKQNAAPPAGSASSREKKVAVLREEASDLRGRLAKIVEQLDNIEKEG